MLNFTGNEDAFHCRGCWTRMHQFNDLIHALTKLVHRHECIDAQCSAGMSDFRRGSHLLIESFYTCREAAAGKHACENVEKQTEAITFVTAERLDQSFISGGTRIVGGLTVFIQRPGGWNFSLLLLSNEDFAPGYCARGHVEDQRWMFAGWYGNRKRIVTEARFATAGWGH